MDALQNAYDFVGMIEDYDCMVLTPDKGTKADKDTLKSATDFVKEAFKIFETVEDNHFPPVTSQVDTCFSGKSV